MSVRMPHPGREPFGISGDRFERQSLELPRRGTIGLTRLELSILNDPLVQFGLRRAESRLDDGYVMPSSSGLLHALETLDVVSRSLLLSRESTGAYEIDERWVAVRLATLLHPICDVFERRCCAMAWGITAENPDELVYTHAPRGLDGVNEVLAEAGGEGLVRAVWGLLGGRGRRARVDGDIAAACVAAIPEGLTAFASPLRFPGETTNADRMIVIPGLVDAAGCPMSLDDRRTNLRAIQFSETTLRAMSDRPELLHDLSPDRFERLIAELLRRSGCSDVVVTGGPRDGGVDVWAVRKDDLGTMVVVAQCKRYRET